MISSFPHAADVSPLPETFTEEKPLLWKSRCYTG
jgi:hypothetical protein